jgi:hypothetical protein
MLLFLETVNDIKRWNSKAEGQLGVWAILPKDGKFSGKI